jgi:hypothetical protein
MNAAIVNDGNTWNRRENNFIASEKLVRNLDIEFICNSRFEIG